MGYTKPSDTEEYQWGRVITESHNERYVHALEDVLAAAKGVIELWDSPDLALAVNALRETIEENRL